VQAQPRGHNCPSLRRRGSAQHSRPMARQPGSASIDSNRSQARNSGRACQETTGAASKQVRASRVHSPDPRSAFPLRRGQYPSASAPEQSHQSKQGTKQPQSQSGGTSTASSHGGGSSAHGKGRDPGGRYSGHKTGQSGSHSCIAQPSGPHTFSTQRTPPAITGNSSRCSHGTLRPSRHLLRPNRHSSDLTKPLRRIAGHQDECRHRSTSPKLRHGIS
jgi:hypothetical protein